MAAWDKDRKPSDASHGAASWRAIWAFILGCVVILASLWLVMYAAGTDWAIPIAVMLVIVALASLWSERER